MAKNDKKKRRGFNPMTSSDKRLQSLYSSTQATDRKVYGVGKNVPALLLSNLEEYSDKINSDRERNKSLINTHMTTAKILKSKKENESIYDIIKDKNVMGVIEGALGTENIRFTQLLKDYEIVKRCIPQIHRVVNLIISSILSPDSMGSDNIVGIEIPTGTTEADQKIIRDIIDKYKINQRLQDDIVRDYLIASVKYVTVVPYNMIPDMLRPDPNKEGSGLMNLNEAIERFDRYVSSSIMTLNEACGGFDNEDAGTLLESAFGTKLDYYETDVVQTVSDVSSIVSEQLKNIEFIDGGAGYFKNAIINEAVETYSSEDKELKSMNAILNRVRKGSYRKDFADEDSYAAEGFIDEKTYKDINRNVDFKGAHIEYLPADRTVAFKLRDTVVGYFYVEDMVNPNQVNSSSIMDKINASVYIQNTAKNRSKEVEDSVVRSIANKLIKSVNSKFINDNMEDIDIIYEFVKYNEIHKKSKRVVFFHPDDVCEFRRMDGSIMKNAMFFAKLAILMLLSNVITKVTRGSDRQIHYVKTGLTTDIEGSVNDTIRAIKQNQIRYSDIGTINEIFNFVGANVDVFMPVSIDGDKPIETDTIPGQNIDMNDDFISWIIRSILHAFDLPPSLIDDLDSVQFAKTIAMSNIESAKTVYNAQVELNPDLTKMIQHIVHYELPEYDRWREIKASFNPPAVIIYELTRDRLGAVDEFAEKILELFVAPDGEQPAEKRRRLMKLEYFKKNMPTWDWDEYEAMYRKVKGQAKKEGMEDDIDLMNDANEDDQFASTDNFTAPTDQQF